MRFRRSSLRCVQIVGAAAASAPSAPRNQTKFTPPTKAMMTKMKMYCSATPRSSDAAMMSTNRKIVTPPICKIVVGAEILFCLTLMILARMRMNGILQSSAGWMLKGRKLKFSQLRLPCCVSPHLKRRAMKTVQNRSSSSRRSAMMSTSISVSRM